MNVLDKIFDFLQGYRLRILFISGILLAVVIFLPRAYGMIKIVLAFVAVFLSGLNFPKIPEDAENRSRAVTKSVLRALLAAVAALMVCLAVAAILHPEIFHGSLRIFFSQVWR